MEIAVSNRALEPPPSDLCLGFILSYHLQSLCPLSLLSVCISLSDDEEDIGFRSGDCS